MRRSHADACGTVRCGPAVLVLIEPTTSPKNDLEKEELLSSIWPLIVRAAGKISLIKELVRFMTVERSMVRAGRKRTIQRKRTLEIYEMELDQLYRDFMARAK